MTQEEMQALSDLRDIADTIGGGNGSTLNALCDTYENGSTNEKENAVASMVSMYESYNDGTHGFITSFYNAATVLYTVNPNGPTPSSPR